MRVPILQAVDSSTATDGKAVALETRLSQWRRAHRAAQIERQRIVRVLLGRWSDELSAGVAVGEEPRVASALGFVRVHRERFVVATARMRDVPCATAE